MSFLREASARTTSAGEPPAANSDLGHRSTQLVDAEYDLASCMRRACEHLVRNSRLFEWENGANVRLEVAPIKERCQCI